jgi:hypothetical protein
MPWSTSSTPANTSILIKTIPMKKIAAFILASSLICCGEAPEKKNDPSSSPETPQQVSSKVALPSGDYSSLLLNYECDMTASEVAKIMNLPETDVKRIETILPARCVFEIQGYGSNALGGTQMAFGTAPVPKRDIQREIQSRLKDQANNESMFGDGIKLSETGDSYISITPRLGRVEILNENYDNAFFFNVSQRGIYKRTPEKHEELMEKTIALANYVLKKHKK